MISKSADTETTNQRVLDGLNKEQRLKIMNQRESVINFIRNEELEHLQQQQDLNLSKSKNLI
jgi:hypothetical protein